MTIVKKIILFVSLLMTFVIVQTVFCYLNSLEKNDLFWGITVKYHFIVYCGIIGVYCMLFPRMIAIYLALVLQTISFYFFFSSMYPLRSIEMNMVAYLCIIVPFFQKCLRKITLSPLLFLKSFLKKLKQLTKASSDGFSFNDHDESWRA